jgi:spermidine/putrescine transport system substrate-binding protein
MSERDQDSATRTLGAASALTRRTLLKASVATAAAATGPWYVREAFSQSGQLNWFTWEDYAPKPLVEKFTKETGIKLNVTVFSTNEEQLNKLRAARGEGFDLCTPSVAWVGAHIDAGNIQAFDEKKLAGPMGRMIPTFVNKIGELGGRRDGKLYCVPTDWGSEALSFNTKAMNLEYGKASFGDLWDPRWAGKMLCRPRSIMLGVGMWWEGKGEIPAGTMQKCYSDQPTMEKYYGMALEYCIKNKKQIGKWWTSTAETQAGFLQEGCVIGMTWDGPINTMRNEGHPVKYLAPKEGALTWVDTVSLTKGAKNLDQVYAFIDFMLKPENGGLFAVNTGYNSVVKGAEKFTNANFQRNFEETYPGDALQRLWFQGEERPWFIAKRQEFATKLQAA